ncbi:class III signal peptide-containing protein [Candidatus Micrarchaeota archaeon]|nr:class III signal peptide-containing protein [Candidatus Micrarchaeota archaeon]MBU2476951.1 class III signal peptide-containing protein [Candidatus Micrarchaeota archaeon]
MFGRKAQGTTEYLIILAVIIVIALVVVGVMGWVPGLSGGITEQQSRVYWQSTAPFTIVEYKFDAGLGTASLEVQNVSANKLELTGVDFEGIAGTVTGQPISFNAGERKLVSVTGLTGTTCETSAAGTGFDYTTIITYDSKNVTGLKQIGDKSLIGKCN